MLLVLVTLFHYLGFKKFGLNLVKNLLKNTPPSFGKQCGCAGSGAVYKSSSGLFHKVSVSTCLAFELATELAV